MFAVFLEERRGKVRLFVQPKDEDPEEFYWKFELAEAVIFVGNQEQYSVIQRFVGQGDPEEVLLEMYRIENTQDRKITVMVDHLKEIVP